MTSFADLGINKNIVKAIDDKGWTDPTPVQIQTLPTALEGKDVLVQAQTGTGKTGAYATVVLSRVAAGQKKPSSLILTPTRELAKQVEFEIYSLSKYSNHRSIAIYGGASIMDQLYRIERGVDIIVGTPGRLKDLMTRGSLDLSQVTEVVLDEADRMLDMGFADELNFIMERVPKERHTQLFSATMAKEIKGLALSYMVDTVEISTSSDELCNDLTTQYYVVVERGKKRTNLETMLENGNPKTIVFCQTKRMVDQLVDDLSKNYKVAAIHGDLPQIKREKVMRNYKRDMLSVLIATDVAARGIDVNNIDLVVNYDIPDDQDTYLHRIGRTGRAGNKGIAISLVTRAEEKRIKQFEKNIGKRIERIRPSEMERIERIPKAAELRDKAEQRPKKSEDEEFAAQEARERREPVRDDRKQFKAVMVKKTPPVKKESSGKASDKVVVGMIPVQINLGKDDIMGRGEIAQFVKQTAKLNDNEIGRVGLGKSASYVEISGEIVNQVLDVLMSSKHGNKKIFVTMAPAKTKYKDKPRD